MTTIRIATVTMAAALVAAGALRPSAVSANHVGPSASVDCSGGMPGAFTSINAALATLPVEGPHVVFVSGTCQETVDITGRRWLTIAAPETAVIAGTVQPPRPTVLITDSAGIVLRNLTIRGDGVRVSSSTVDLFNVTSEQSRLPGLIVAGSSMVRITVGQFLDNAGPGIRVEPGATVQMSGVRSRANAAGIASNGGQVLLDGDVTLEENRGAGLSASGGILRLNTFRGPNTIRANSVGLRLTDGASAVFNGLTVVKEHAGYGIEASLGASVNFQTVDAADGSRQGTTIEENGSVGINLAGSASANADGVLRVRHNGRRAAGSAGLRVGSTSRIQLFGAEAEISGNSGPGVVAEWNAAVFLGEASITNNGEEGVRVVRNSVAMLGGTVAGNGGGSVTCDTTGLVVLQTDAIAGVRCARVEREHGPPRPGAVK